MGNQGNGSKPFLQTKDLALTAVMAAVMCVLGPMAVPIGPVPISLTNLVIYVSLYVLGMKRATISYLVYFLLGLVGLPVFSGFTGGVGKAMGPTGGYLIGFIFIALLGGLVVDRFPEASVKSIVISLIGMIVSTAICYIFGTAWFVHQQGMTWGASLSVCVFPFIPGDLIKMVIAVAIGPVIRGQLKKAGLN